MISGIQGNSAVTTAMMAEMRDRMFAKLDGDGDGMIDLSQLESDNQSTGRVDDRFEHLLSDLTAADTDGDGKVSRAEFEAMKPPTPPGDAGQQNMPNLLDLPAALDDSTTGKFTAIGTLLDQLV